MCATRAVRPHRAGRAWLKTKPALFSAGLLLFSAGVIAGRLWRSEIPTTGVLPLAGARLLSRSAPPVPASDAILTVPHGVSSAARLGPAQTAGTRDERGRALALLAQTDPRRALEIAAQERNWQLRDFLRNKVLNGWASTAPNAAADFALALPEQERREAIAAVLAGATNDAHSAVRLAQRICASDTTLAEDHGRAAITALGEVGAHAEAVGFALSAEETHRADWLRAAFYQWSDIDPPSALKALDAITSSDVRASAFEGLALGWSKANAEQLASYSVALPAGEERTFAVRQALTEWLARDPGAAAAWIDRFEPGEEFDLGAAKLAALPALAKKYPEVALSWAASIVEPSLRTSTLATVGHQLAHSSPELRTHLLEAAKDLPAEDRKALLYGIQVETTE